MKRWMKAILVLALVLTLPLGMLLFPKAEEEGAIASGFCGEEAIWTLYENGTMVISGTGVVSKITDTQWQGYEQQVTELIVEEGIVVIDSETFSGWEALKVAYLPETLTHIQDGAFLCCSSLQSVSLPDSLESIEDMAFCSTDLSQVYIPENVSYIGNRAFAGGRFMEGVWVDENNPYYCNDSWGALYNKEKTHLMFLPVNVTEEYVLPEGVLQIENSIWDDKPERLHTRVWEGGVYLGTAANPYYAYLRSENPDPDTSVIHEDTRVLADDALPCGTFTSVTLPENLIGIGDGVFWQCENLEEIEIPEGVRFIGTYAFGYCSALKAIRIPAGVKEIKFQSFFECRALSQVHLEAVEVIGESAFSGCVSLQSITLPQSLHSMDDCAFANTGLTEITIPAAVNDIGFAVFNDSGSLGTVTFLGSAPYFAPYALNGISALIIIPGGDSTWDLVNREDLGDDLQWSVEGGSEEEVEIASGVCGAYVTWSMKQSGHMVISGTGPMWDFLNEYEEWAMQIPNLTRLTIEEGVTYVGISAFWDAQNLSRVTLADSITDIEESAFNGAGIRGELKLPKNLRNIGRLAFANCYRITSVSIGEDLETLEDTAFASCTYLKAFQVAEENPYFSSDDSGVLYHKDQTVLLQIPDGMSGDYVLPEGVLEIKFNAIPDHMNLNYQVYDGCKYLGTASNPYYAVLRAIGERSAYTLHPDTKIIAGGAFYDMDALTAVNLNEGLLGIGEEAFYFCSGLNGVRLPKTLVRLGAGAFTGTALTEVTIPEGITILEDSVFGYCGALRSVTLPQGLKKIGGGAFAGCSSLTRVDFPNSLEEIGKDAFHSCSGLTELDLKNVRTIEAWAFACCNGLTELTIPDSVDSIGQLAFEQCGYLKKVTCTSTGATLGMGVFAGCWSMETISFQGNAPQLDESCFINLNAIIYYPIYDDTWDDVAVHQYSGTISWFATFTDTDQTYQIDSGFCGNEIRWILDSHGTMTFSGSGPMYDFGYDATWNEYASSVTEVIIESGITTVGSYTFYNWGGLRTVTFSGSVRSIGAYAFAECTGLTTLTIPGHVRTIGEAAFSSCWNLRDLTLSGGVRQIGEYAFQYCNELEEITIPKSVTDIAPNAFEYCDGLTGFRVDPNNTVYSSDSSGVLYDRDQTILVKAPAKLKGDYRIPQTVQEIRYDAFRIWETGLFYHYYEGCDYLGTVSNPYHALIKVRDRDTTAVTIHPDTVVIAGGAFDGCAVLREITLSQGLQGIGERAFSGCGSLQKLALPEGLLRIGKGSFQGCDDLTELVLPESLTVVSPEAFAMCSSLKKVTLGSKVESIGQFAFGGCSALQQLSIPDSVTHVGFNAFGECGQLKTTVLAQCEYIGNAKNPYHILLSVNDSGMTYCMLAQGTKVVADHAFEAERSLETVVLPEGLTHIGDGAFISCIALTRVLLPTTLVSIGDEAFSECKSLSGFVLPAQVAILGDGAFSFCDRLNVVYFLGNAPQFGEDVFRNVTSTVRYHFGAKGWSAADDYDYGGDLTWSQGHIYVNYEPDHNGSCTQDSTMTAKCECCNATSSILDERHSGHRYANGSCTVCGDIAENYTGLTKISDHWYYLRKGKIATDLTTLIEHNGSWYYLHNGEVDFGATTLVKYYGTWYYVSKGVVDFNANTLVKWNGEWFYVVDGKVASYATTLVKWYGEWFYVVGGKLAAKTTTLVKWNGSWYYIYKGKLAAQTTTLVKHNGNWYYVIKGKLATQTTTLVKYNGSWYYIYKGKLAAQTTLVKYSGSWYYVENGKVNFSYSGSIYYQYHKYTVKNGKVLTS